MPAIALFARYAAGGPPPGVTGPPPGVTGPPPGIESASSGSFVAIGSGGHALGGNPQSKPDFAMPQSQINIITGLITMFMIMCIAVVGLRFASRRLNKQRIGADDVWILTALVLFIGQAIVIYYNLDFLSKSLKAAQASLQSGKLKKPDFVMVLRLKLGASLLYACAITAARTSLLYLYKRIFGHRVTWFKALWWLAIVAVFIYLTIFFVISLAACAALTMGHDWPKSLSPGSCGHDNYYSPEPFAYANAAIDLTLMFLPIRMIWSLQMSKRQKIGVTGVFGLGLIAVTISFARAIIISTNASFSTAKGAFLFLIFSTVEPCIIIICACLPITRPLFIKAVKVIGGSGSWLNSLRTSRKKTTQQYGMSSKSAQGDEKPLTRTSSRSILAVTSTEQTIGSPKVGKAEVVDSWAERPPFNDDFAYSPKVKTTIEAREIKALPLPPPCQLNEEDGNVGDRVRYFRQSSNARCEM